MKSYDTMHIFDVLWARFSLLRSAAQRAHRDPRTANQRAIARAFAWSVAGMTWKPKTNRENPTYDWVVYEIGLPYLKLAIDVPVAIVLRELPNIRELLVPHLAYGNTQGWSSFCLHGKAFDATREDSYYSDDRPYEWTPEAKERMPETVRYFRDVWPHSRYQRLRVMRLSPGGFIGVHRDSPTSHLGPINIAVTQPRNCRFLMEGCGCLPFTEGDSIFLNVSYRHAVFNDSGLDRYHIIIHQEPNEEFKRLVLRSYLSNRAVVG